MCDDPWHRPAIPAVGKEAIKLGARAIARSQGHDPDALAPRTFMCTADNQQVPWWQVFEEQAEACLLAATPAVDGEALKEALERYSNCRDNRPLVHTMVPGDPLTVGDLRRAYAAGPTSLSAWWGAGSAG